MCLSVQRSNEVINPHPGGTPPTLIPTLKFPHLGVVGHDIDRRIILYMIGGEEASFGHVDRLHPGREAGSGIFKGD